jgi:hypothetical protein
MALGDRQRARRAAERWVAAAGMGAPGRVVASAGAACGRAPSDGVGRDTRQSAG